jgi:hypothetical protein
MEEGGGGSSRQSVERKGGRGRGRQGGRQAKVSSISFDHFPVSLPLDIPRVVSGKINKTECTHMEDHTGVQKTWVHAIKTGWNSLDVPHNPHDLR